jgi:hypothetical protein
VDVPSAQDFGDIFNLIGGYRISQAIYAVAELGIPDLLAAGPRRCDELARETNTHAPTLFRILRFLTGAGLFNELGPKEFELTRLGSTLRTDLPGSFHPAVRFLLGEFQLACGPPRSASYRRSRDIAVRLRRRYGFHA